MGAHGSDDAARRYFDGLARAGIRLGLDTVRELARRLGEPHRAFTTIHVAGTNGKGSVVAFVERALAAAGHRTGAFVSPKLQEDRDQIRVEEAPVEPGAYAAALLRVRDAAAGRGAAAPLDPTQFEALTGAAFEIFRAGGVGIAVVEAGVGGELDATNIVAPIAAAITSVGLDHRALLGGSLESIARHKAGVLKPGAPVVIGSLPPGAERIVREVAAERGCPVIPAREGCVVSSDVERERAVVEVATDAGRYGPVTLALRGEHQVENAVVAVRLLEAARARGVTLTAADVERGLADAVWPARLEMLALAGGRRLLVDAAHNADGAAALARHLRRHHPERPPLVFAAMRDKDVRGMLAALLPTVGAVVVTGAGTARAADPRELGETARALDPAREVVVEPDPLHAVERAWRFGPMPCVAGSIALAGAVRGALLGRAIVDFSR